MADGQFGKKKGNSVQVLAIIPARGGSKGIPMKNIVKLGKFPLLHYTIDAALKSSIINKIVVTSDNFQILKIAEKMGVDTIHRPKKLSGNKIGLEPTILHTLNHLKNKKYIPDYVITLQNTSPFRNHMDIDRAFSILKKGRFDSVVSAFKSHNLMWKYENEYSPINYDLFNRPNRQQMKNQFIENGAIYITKYSLLKKNQSRISGKIGLYEMPEESSIQIDSEYDLLLAKEILKKMKGERQ
jgi:CMP-N,N'-diacetyllegionaminic acid synthase